MSSLSADSDARFAPLSRNTLLAIENVDEINVSALDKSVRAVIFPKSESAVHSLHLDGNEDASILIRGSVRLPSPCESCSEDEVDNIIRKSGQHAAVLMQSQEKGWFTFGSSLESDIILEHLSASPLDEERCYINYVHAELYPNPDDDDLLLYNRSTSLFTLESLSLPWNNKTVYPKEKFTLERGSWNVTFGEGLDFQIKILPWRPPAMGQTWTQIFPIPVPIKSHSNRKANKPALHHNTLPSLPPPISTEKGPRRKRSSIAKDQDTVKITPSSKGSNSQTPLSPSDTVSPVQRELILENKNTLVYKVFSKKGVSAMKYCRGSDAKASVETWVNERDILRSLDHSSITKLFSHDAINLSLGLEYVGPDLSRFRDEDRMSTLTTNQQHQVWIDVSCGLEYIKAQNIIHLDIKPQNVLLSPGNRAKICDFGLSVITTAGSKVSGGGTPDYIPPEYIRYGKRGHSADIWAFGITMLFVKGLVPLPNGNWMIKDVHGETEALKKMRAWLKQIQRIRANLPQNLSILHRMLEFEPEDRITPTQVVNDLRKTQRIEAAPANLIAQSQ